MSAPAAPPLSPAEITRRSKSNFGLSFLLLDRERREAMNAIYAYCRVIDDIADEEGFADGDAALRSWREELARVYDDTCEPDTEIGSALRRAAKDYGVRRADLEEILDGVTRDLTPTRYATFEELEGYCFQVASAVGLACLPILDGDPELHQDYAKTLGFALQLTNILRDLRSDAERGRVYAPQDLLVRSGVPSDQAEQLLWLCGRGPEAAYQASGALDRVVAELAARAEDHFKTSVRAMPDPVPAGFLVSEVMAAVYHELLVKLRALGARAMLRPDPVRLSRARRFFLVLRTRWRGHR